MQLPVVKSGHTCRCHDAVPTVDFRGGVLWSHSPVVMDKLDRACPRDEAGHAVLRTEGWLDDLSAFADTLSPVERSVLLVAPVGADGVYDPWQAAPVDTVLMRARTEWFPAALNEGRIVSWFQPIAAVATGQTAGFECLARAEAGGRLRNGGELIDAARAHAALFQFDQKTRTGAIRQGLPRLRPGELLFVNFLPMVIYDPTVCLRTTWQAASEVGGDLSSVVFEVVESEAFPDLDHLKWIMRTYQERGAKVALDDLGTGNNALTYIEALKPDYVKLAKGMLPNDPTRESLSLVSGVVSHSRELGVKIVVEGIETREQWEAAGELGIDLAQGWYIAKPAAEPMRPVVGIRRAAA